MSHEKSASAARAAPQWLPGDGAMSRLIGAMDWSKTPLGPIESWPQSLRTTVSLCLASNFPISLVWGPQCTQLYNDGYWPICGAKHPHSMGQDFRECWASAWPAIGEAFERARAGETSFLVDQRVFIDRYGYLEEAFFTFSFSPIRDESGGIGGLFHPVTETTSKMLSERRTRTLRELGARLGKARSLDEVLALTVEALKPSEFDLPFGLLYVQGIDKDAPLEAFGLAAPIRETLETGATVHVDGLAPALVRAHPGPYPEPPRGAMVIPIRAAGQERPWAVYVAGISARLALDELYRAFYDQIGATVSAAAVNARLFEEERKRAEALAELDRAKTAFFSNVSHEFRTPLTLMLGPLEEALADPVTGGEQRSRLELAHRSSLRLLKLVNTLLEFSRIEAGRADALFAPTDLAACTADLAASFRSAIEKAGIAFEVDCPPLGEDIYVDRDMWEKIVLNLLSNAFKFTERGRITLRQRLVPGALELSVADTGIGIPAGEQPKVFKRFHRIENARGRSHEGTGIGLALVHELAQLHGGEVRLESREGEGSVFTVLIPRGKAHLPEERIGQGRAGSSTRVGAEAFVEEASRWIAPGLEEAPAEDATPTDARRARILVADDNADMLAYVTRVLSPGFEVRAVRDGLQALAAARATQPDLVLSDVMMPGLDGFGLLKALREDPQTLVIPVVLLSARAGEEARVEGLDAGADDYLVKPFSARELRARVRATLALASTRQEIARRDQEALDAAKMLELERAARAEAEHVSRMKDEFLSTLSHELRTPLHAIMGWAQLLRLGKPHDVPAAAETIERNARLQTRIIDDLLDMSRIVSGKVRLDVKELDLAEPVEAAMRSVMPAAEAKKLRIETHAEPGPRSVRGDPGRLQQVVWNLLTNSIKFTPTGGSVRIALGCAGSRVQLQVSDTGGGITPEFLPHVFERFRQADSSTTRRHGGLGLGLSIVKQLVEMHGGTVRAQSDGAGKGATFTVSLPLLAVSAAKADARRKPAVHAAVPDEAVADTAILRGIEVLVIDDDADARMLVRRVLEGCQARVITAGSAKEALELLQRRPPTVIVSDIGMPEQDGFALLRRIRALGGALGSIPAVALTAFARAEDRRRAMLAGFQTHIVKPVDTIELIAAIANLAGRSAAGAEC